ncbi:MAG: hypothetical protein V1776_04610 [Candidatus Diapherotrites archaeon]
MAHLNKKRGKKFIFTIPSRGQAAVTDALFLLVIISSLTGFLFLFAANYGKGIADQVNRNGSFEFVSSALKTIMYQSVTRDSTQAINVLSPDPDLEVDYLMAMVKEDYADDQNLSLNTKRSLAKSIYHVMRPIADNQDYLFAINTAQKYVLIILWRTNFVVQDSTGAYVPWGGTVDPERFQNVLPNPSEPHEMFFCNPSITDNAVQKLFLRVGTATQAQSLINMVEFSGSSFLLALDTTEIRAGVILSTWTATPIPDEEWNLLKCEKIPPADIIPPS